MLLEVAPSPYIDADRYIVVRKLLNSVISVKWALKPPSSHRFSSRDRILLPRGACSGYDVPLFHVVMLSALQFSVESRNNLLLLLCHFT
jgi:hypothetical protein